MPSSARKKKHIMICSMNRCFFFNDTATTEIYTLSLHDALPIACPNGHANAGEMCERVPPTGEYGGSRAPTREDVACTGGAGALLFSSLFSYSFHFLRHESATCSGWGACPRIQLEPPEAVIRGCGRGAQTWRRCVVLSY